MHEFEQNFPDWRKQIESAVFYDNRRDEISHGTQHTVYTNKWLDLVVKIPTDPRWQQGYNLIEDVAPDLAIPFIVVQGLKLNVNRRISVIPEAILQTKVARLDSAIITNTKNQTQAKRLIEQQIEADRELLRRGIFVPDPNFANYGIEKSGEVKRFDFGDARFYFSGEMEYGGLARARAGSHYVNFLFLRLIGLTDLSQFYAQEMELPPVPPEISTLEKLGKSQTKEGWNPEIAAFLGRIGDKEIRQLSSNGIGFEFNEDLVRNMGSIL